MANDENSLEQGYEGSVYDSSLEASTAPMVTATPDSGSSYRTTAMRKLFGFNKLAFAVTGGAIGIILLIGLISLFVGNHSKTAQGATDKAANYKVGSLALKDVSTARKLDVGQADHLTINGQLRVANGLYLEPATTAPTGATAGQIYYDKATNAPYYFNGSKFVSLAPQAIPASVTSLGGVSGVLALGNGLQVSGNQLSISSALLQSVATAGATTPKVTSLQGLTGNITLSGGPGITITGTTISNNGVLDLRVDSGTANLIVTRDANGVYTIADTTAATAVVNSVGGASGVLSLGSGLGVSGNTISNTGVLSATGTANQIAVTSASGDITFSLPQDIATSSSPTFAAVSLGGATITGGATVQGASGLTIGSAGTVDGKIVLNNGTNSHTTTLQGLALNTQDQTIVIPASSAVTDTVCLLTLANCAGAGGGITGTGSKNFITKYTNNAGDKIGNSLLYDDNTTVGINTISPNNAYVLDVNGAANVNGAINIAGALTLASDATFNGNIAQSGAGTFSTGTGAVTLNGAVSISGVNTLSVGTGAATFGGTIQATGLATLNGGVTITGVNSISGATTINGSGANATSIGNALGSFSVTSTGLNVNTAGAVSGVSTLALSGAISGATSGNTINGVVINAGALSATSLSSTGAITGATSGNTINGVVINSGALSSVSSIATNGGYTQTGSGANTFTGGTTFSGAGTGLTVSNNALVSGNLTVQGSSLALGTVIQQGSLVLNAGNGLTGTIIAKSTLAQNTIYTLPDPGTATATICLSTGNCAGSGTGLTGSGTPGKLSKFSTSNNLVDSGLSEAGTQLTYAGNLVVNPLDTFSGNLIDIQSGGISKLAVTEAGAATLAGSLTVQSGGIAVTGNSTIAGSLSSLTGITSSGTITLSGLSSGVVHASAGGVLSSSAVVLGTDTTGNYVANIGTVTGLTVTGGGSAGSTPNISVNYGSTANTAAQGNTALTFNGSGNLTGTLSGTAGGGFTTTTLAVSNSPTFTGTVNVQGAGGLTIGRSNGATGTDGLLNLASGSNNNVGTIKLKTTGIGQNTSYILPDAGAASDTICLYNLGNCGAANAVAGTGTVNTLAKFTGASAISDSLITDDGTDVTIGGNLVATNFFGQTIQSTGALNITPGGALTIGASNQVLALQGNATSTFSVSSSGNTSILGFVTPTANRTINLPDESGTVCLQGSSNCGFATSGSGVTGITGSVSGSVAAVGGITFNDAVTTAGTITIRNAKADGTTKGIATFNASNFKDAAGVINTIQNIDTAAAVTFGSLTLGTGGDLTLSGTGTVKTDKIKSSTAGGGISIDAQNGSVTITTDGGANSFVLPSYGGLGQVICTSGITCATGGGTAVVLEPSAVQTATSNGTAIYINKASGSGNLLQLQTGGVDAFTIDNTGNATLSGNTTANNLLINGILTADVITATSSLTIGDPTLPVTIQGDGTSVFVGKDAASGFTTSIGYRFGSGVTAPTGNIVYQLQNDSMVAPGTYDICTTAGNCSGVGGSVTTGGGTPGAIAKFTTAGNIEDSLISEAGNTIHVGGNLQVGVSGASQVNIGVASSATGTLVFNNSSNANTITLQQTAAPSTNISIGIPTTSGTFAVAATGPLSLDPVTGILSCSTCLSSGGGGAGGVTSLNGLTGVLSVANASASGSTITINDAKADGTTKGIAAFNSTNFSDASGVINTKQDINTTATPTFNALTLQGPGGLSIGSSTNLGQLAFKDGTADGFTSSFTPATLTASRSIIIPNAGGTLAVSASGNLALSPLGNLTISNAPNFTTSVTTPSLQALGNLAITPGAGGVLTIGATANSLAIQGNASTTISATNSGSTSTVSFAVPTGARSIVFPDASGTICLSSGNCLGGASGSANTALSNLVNVAINVDLKPTTAASANLGTTAIPFGTLVIAGGSSSPGTNNFVVTGTSTGGTRTITLPDASGTVCLQSDTNCGFAAANNVVNSITGATSGSVAAQGGLTFNNALTTSGAITIDNAKADGTTKGIAAFNATNFSASAGLINTAQNINSTATPTFGGLTLSSALTVGNGGTGVNTLTTKGILYGNGTGNILATTAANDSVLVTSAVGVPSLQSTLPTAVQGNITTVGALTSGSIGGTFSTISTTNNITTTAGLQGGTLSVGSGAFTVTSGGNIATTGAAAVQGVLALGAGSTANGTITFANSANNNLITLSAPTATAARSYTLPDSSAANDTICLLTLANCAGAGSGVTASGGVNNYVPRFTAATALTSSQIYDDGTFVGVNTATNGGQLSVVAAGSQTGLFIKGATAGVADIALIRASAGGSGNLLVLQNSSNTTVAYFNSAGALQASGVTSNGTTTLNGNTSVSGTNTFTTGSGAVTLGSLGAGIVQSNASGLLSSSSISRNSALLTGTESVGNGGTGATSFTANGILFGNGSSALQVTSAANNSVLVTDGSGNPSLQNTLPATVQGNITALGAVTSGSLGGSFSTINIASNITTSAVLQGGSLNVTGVSSLVGTATLGTPGSVNGFLAFGNATNTNTIIIQGLAPTGTGNVTLRIPALAGGTTADLCTTTGNCAGSGTGVTASTPGTANYVAKFSAGQNIGNSQIFDDGTFVGVNTAANGGQLSVVAAGAQSGLFVQGAGSGSAAVSIIRANGSTGPLLQLQNSSSTPVASFTNTGDITLAGTLNLTGAASYPSSPTEGTVFFNTATKQLDVYANGKWQADRSTATVIVAASNSQNKEKADFVGNGTADDVAINAAIAAVPSTGGSVVLLDGTYNITAPVVIGKSNVTLTGQGASTILKRMYDSAASEGIVNVTSATQNTDNVTITRFAINGNKATYTSTNDYGFYASTGNCYQGYFLRVTELSVTNTKGRGIYIGGLGCGTNAQTYVGQNSVKGTDDSSIVVGYGGFGVTINANNISSSNANGVEVGSSTSSTSITDNYILNSVSTGINVNSSYPVQISGNTVYGGATGINIGYNNAATVTGNTVTSTTANGMILGLNQGVVSGNTISFGGGTGINSTSVNTTFSSNNISSNAGEGIFFYGGDTNLVIGNTLFDNAGSSGGSSIHLSNNGGNVNNKLIDNVIRDTAGTGYAIRIDSGLAGNYLSNNTFSGTGATAISDQGVNTIYANQQDSNGNIDLRGYAGVGINTTSPTASLQNAGGFVNNAISAPAAPTVAAQGTTGSTTWGYKVTAYDGIGETLASTETTIANGNATLNSSNYNLITPARVSGAVSYKIYRTTAGGTPSTTGLIGTLAGGASTFNFSDTGLAASGSLPTANTTGSATIATFLGINNASPSSRLTINAVNPDALAQAIIGTGAASNKGLVIQGTTSQTADLLQLQNVGGGVVAAFKANGDLSAGAIYGTSGTQPGIYAKRSTTGQILVAESNTAIVFSVDDASVNLYKTLYATASAANSSAIVVNAAASQTADLLRVNNNLGQTLTALDATGRLVFYNTGSLDSPSTNLYRSAASTLKTDSSLIVGTLGSSATTLLCVDGSNKLSTCASGGSGGGSTGAFISNSTSLQTSANFNIQSAAAGSVGGVIRGATSQTADLLQLQLSNGTSPTKFDSAGNLILNGSYISLDGSPNHPAISFGGSALQIGNYTNTNFYTNNFTVNSTGTLFTNQAPGTVTMQIQGTTSFTQTADLVQYLNASGAALSGVSAAGNIYLNAGQSLKVNGSTSFPGSPTEGQVYFRTDTKQLYVYENGSWQAQRTGGSTYVVAASNSLNKDKADFVADGTNDQAEINAAIAALPANGGSVVLLDGTFNIGATILMNKDNVTLTGQGNNTILKRVYNEATPDTGGVITTTNWYLTITNLNIDGNKANYASTNNIGLFMTYSCIGGFNNVNNIHVGNTGGYGIGNVRFACGGGTARITNNHVESAGTVGIYDNGYNTVISGNYVTGSGTHGISEGGQNNNITNNTLISNTGAGINIAYSPQGLVSGNTLQSNTTGIALAGSVAYVGLDVSNNHINGGTSGITAGGNANQVTITDNDLGAMTNGINVASGTFFTFSGNTFFAVGTPFIDGSTNAIYNNQIDGNGNMILRGDGGVGINTTAPTASLQNTGALVQGGLATPGAPTVTAQGGGSGTSYTYAVTAYDGLGETLASGTTSVSSAATLNGTTFNRIIPQKVPGAVSYKIYRTASAGTPSTTGLIGTLASSAGTFQFDDTGLAGSGASTPSFNTTGGALLQTNGSVTIQNATNTSAIFSANANNKQVLIGGLTAPSGVAAALIGAANTPTISNNGTAGSTVYSYQVVALTSAGYATVPSAAGSTATGNATLTSGNSNTVSWTAVAGATSYQVYRSASSGTPSSTGLIGSTTGTSLIDTGLAANVATPTTTGLSSGTTYYYKVTAFDSAGGQTTASTEVSQATSATRQSVALSWSAVPGARSYRVYRGTSSNGENVYFNATTNNFTDYGISTTSGTPPTANSAYATSFSQAGTSQLTLGTAGLASGQLYVGSNAGGVVAVTTAGTAGTAYQAYEVTALDASGQVISGSSMAGSINTANATLSGTNYDQLSWQPIPGAASYNVYAILNSRRGLIGTSNTTTFSDTGQVATGGYPASPSYVGGFSPAIGGVIDGTNYGYSIYSNVLKIVDLSAPSMSAQTVGTATCTGCNFGASRGQFIYTAAGNQLQVIDVSNPGNPTARGTASIVALGVKSVSVAGNYVYVTTQLSNLLIIYDVSNPDAPVQVGSVAISNVNSFTAIQGKYAYVGGNSSTIEAFDISNPRAPVLAGSVTIPSVLSSGLVASGRYLYGVNGNGSMIVIDIANGSSPVLVNTLDVAVSGSPTVAGRLLYVNSGGNDTYIKVFDLSNPAAPVQTGSHVPPTMQNSNGPIVKGNYLYEGNSGNTTYVFNLGGAVIQNLEVSSVRAASLQVDTNTSVGGSLSVSTGLSVSGSSTLAGQLGVGSSLTVQGATQLVGGLQGGVTINGLSTPSAPTVTPTGTTGATNYSYQVVAVGAGGGTTLPSTAGSTTTGNATLTSSNYNSITWAPVTGAVTYKVYRTVAGGTSPTTTGLIATTTGINLSDTGLAASGAVPTSDTSGLLTANGGILLPFNQNINFGDTGHGITAASGVGTTLYDNNSIFLNSGTVRIGYANLSYGTQQSLIISPKFAGTDVDLIARGLAGQTADLFQLQNSGGTVLSGFNAAGQLALGKATSATAMLDVVGGAIFSGISAPAQPTVTNQGTAGGTSYTYCVTALTTNGETACSTVRTTATGNATLDGTNFNRITWTAVTGATGYRLYRTATGSVTAPTTTGRIGSTIASVTTFDDTGIAAIAASSTPPSGGTSGTVNAVEGVSYDATGYTFTRAYRKTVPSTIGNYAEVFRSNNGAGNGQLTIQVSWGAISKTYMTGGSYYNPSGNILTPISTSYGLSGGGNLTADDFELEVVRDASNGADAQVYRIRLTGGSGGGSAEVRVDGTLATGAGLTELSGTGTSAISITAVTGSNSASTGGGITAGFRAQTGQLASASIQAGSNANQANALLLQNTSGTSFLTADGSNTKLTLAGSTALNGNIKINTQAAPTIAPTITNQGTAGSTSYSYVITAVTKDGFESTVGPTGTTATGAATLNGTDFNRISFAHKTGAYSYNVYRTASGGAPASTGLIGNVLDSSQAINANGAINNMTFDDTGIAGTTAAPTVQSGNLVVVGTPTTADTAAQNLISTDNAARKGLVVQGVASQTADLFQLQSSTGTVLSRFDASGNLNLGTMSAPTGGTAGAATAGGSLTAGTYYYKISAIDAGGGETLPSAEFSGTTSGGNLTLPITWNRVAGAVNYRIYRGTSAGNENVYYTSNGGNPVTAGFNDAGSGTTAGTVLTTSTAYITRLNVASGGTSYFNGTLSSPGSGLSSEHFGGGSSATANSSLAIGSGATVSANAAIAIGFVANSAYGGSIAIGSGSQTTAANQLVIGGNSVTNAITNAYIGSGVTDTSINAVTLQGTGSATAGLTGAAFTLTAGAGATTTTGSSGGLLTLQGGASGGTGNNVGGGVTIQGGTSTGTSTGSSVTIKGGTATGANQVGGNVTISGGAPTGTGASGSVIVKPTTNDSTTAFQVQNAAGTQILNVDSSNKLVTVTSGSTDAAFAAAAVDTAAGGASDFAGAFTTTNWTTGTNSATHTSGNTSALSTTFTPTSGQTYQVSYTYTGCSASNTLGVTFGGITLETTTSCTGTNTQVVTATNTSPLSFTPNSTYVGTVSNVKIRLISQTNSVLAVKNSAGTTTLEVRSSGSTTNTFVGLSSGRNNTSTGVNNTGFGALSLQNNTTGTGNTALGYAALQNNTTGSSNNAIGSLTLQNNTTGSDNFAAGNAALASNTTGSRNIAIGHASLLSNTTGTDNVALGEQALLAANNSNQIAIGNFALHNATGFSNTAVGYQALGGATTGNSNTAFGTVALQGVSTGSNNTAIGSGADVLAGALTNVTALGYNAKGGTSNTVVLGNTGTQTIVGAPYAISATNAFQAGTAVANGGLISQTGTTAVTGVSTSFTAGMVGFPIFYNDGTSDTIATVTDATHLTTNSAHTESGSYNIVWGGFTISNSAAVKLQNTSNSSAAFQIQNATGTNLFTVNSSAGQLAVGPAAVAANGVLTIGTNTTTAAGGLYFGTDTNLYRLGASALATDSDFTLQTNKGLVFDGLLDGATQVFATYNGTNLQITNSAVGSSQSIDLAANKLNLNAGDTATFATTNGVNLKADAATAFRVQNAAGTSTYFSADTTNRRVSLDDGGAATANLLVLDKSSAAPSAVQGAIYFDTSGTPGFKCSLDGSTFTSSCFGTATDLQGIYNNSSSPATITTSSSTKNVVIASGVGFDSTAAFKIQASNGNALLSADTTNKKLVLGTGTPTLSAASTGGLYVSDSAEVAGQVRLGDGTNNVTIDATNHQIRFNGNARNARKIRLNAEYSGAVLDADGSNNTGTMTSGFDATQRESYYNWTTSQGSNQDYDVVVNIPVPSDFSSWNGSTPITIDRYTSDTTNGTITASLLDTAGATVTNWNTCAQTPGSTNTWTTSAGCNISSGTFNADGTITLRLHVQSPNGGTVRLGNITLNYLSSF